MLTNYDMYEEICTRSIVTNKKSHNNESNITFLFYFIYIFGQSKKDKNCQKQNKRFFLADFVLQNMVETTLPDGVETSG